MVVFNSRLPSLNLPTNIAVWDWLFDSSISPLKRYRIDELAGYTDEQTKERLNWAQVKQSTKHISTALVRRYGFRAGDTITIFSGNTIWYPVAMFSAVRVGGIVSGASPGYNVDELAYALSKSKSKFLITNSSTVETAVQAAQRAGISEEHVFLLQGEGKGHLFLRDLIEIGKGFGKASQIQSFQIPENKTNKDICGLLCFSSGTTGLPKAVMISHHNIIAQVSQIHQITPSSQNKTLAVLPFYHISGLVHTLHLPIVLNAEVIMLPKFSMEPMLRVITSYQIEELLVVPPLLIRLLHDPIVKDYDLSCVKRFSSGAAPVSDEVMQLLAKKYPGAGFKNGYGMTETTSIISTFPPSLYDIKYAYSVGQLIANTEIRIRNEEGGSDAGIGESGEILVKGPQIVMGYLDNETATRETFDFDGGWLRTGDLGSIDERGIVTIHDRIKEMIKVKGIAVAPSELEDLLLGHEKVQDVAVIGVPDEYSGELPKAFVILKKDVKPAADDDDGEENVKEEIRKYVQERKIRYKWVREIEIVESIPKSASGKILRKELRERERMARMS